MTEVMVVCSIVAFLATISYPTLARVIETAKITRSKSNLKQIHLGLMLYCQSQDGEGPNLLGLPATWLNLQEESKFDPALLRTGGSGWQHPESTSGGDAYTWMVPNVAPGFPGFQDTPGSERDIWKKHVEATFGNPVVMLDATFPGRTGWLQSKRIIGIFFDGHVSVRRYPGSVTYHRQWEP